MRGRFTLNKLGKYLVNIDVELHSCSIFEMQNSTVSYPIPGLIKGVAVGGALISRNVLRVELGTEYVAKKGMYSWFKTVHFRNTCNGLTIHYTGQ